MKKRKIARVGLLFFTMDNGNLPQVEGNGFEALEGRPFYK
jgi:hypothetical protein